MQFQLTINCDNAAFDGDRVIELQRILQTVIENLEYGAYVDYCYTLRDINGNEVGEAVITGD